MKNIKLAILSCGSIYDRKGIFNAVLNRTKKLLEAEEFETDVFLFSTYDPWLVRRLRKSHKVEKPSSYFIDGVKFRIFWYPFSLIDYILTVILHRSALFSKIYFTKTCKMLKGYDFVIAHSTTCGDLAFKVKKKYGVPFSVTWHGSDIHTHPWNNKYTFAETKKIIENADVNFYVSKNLLELSVKITETGVKEVLYNGSDARFRRYNEERRIMLKQQFAVEKCKVVSFVGNFFDVKNVLAIPDIFKEVYKKEKDIVFWMIGDGKLRPEVESKKGELPIVFWGLQSPERIPDFLNCTDVLVLPSKNEGLPLTLVEALKCGCNAVGSLVGGIPEVIGNSNCVSLSDDSFTVKFAEIVLDHLNTGNIGQQVLPPVFDWNASAQKEIETIKRILMII